MTATVPLDEITWAAATSEAVRPPASDERLPDALRAEAKSQRPHRAAAGRATCAVYCDEEMVGNGLLALGSFKRIAPQMSAAMFTSRPQDYIWLKGIDVVDPDEPLRAAHIDVDAWSRQYEGILGHYYRKVAMWLFMLEQTRACTERCIFIDADVLFLRCIQPLLNYARAHPFAAMLEHWHPSVWSVFRREPADMHRQVDLLFHGQAGPDRMKRRPYFNSGFLLARNDNEDLHAAVKDVLAASVLYPELTRRIPFSEQTLFNLATMARRVVCRDLYGMCVPSYHDESRGWPAPVARHYLSDRPHRHPEVLHARYPALVEQSLAAIGTSVEELKDRGLFGAEASSATTRLIESALVESALIEGALMDEQALVAGRDSVARTSKAIRRRRQAIPMAFKTGG